MTVAVCHFAIAFFVPNPEKVRRAVWVKKTVCAMAVGYEGLVGLV